MVSSQCGDLVSRVAGSKRKSCNGRLRDNYCGVRANLRVDSPDHLHVAIFPRRPGGPEAKLTGRPRVLRSTASLFASYSVRGAPIDVLHTAALRFPLILFN